MTITKTFGTNANIDLYRPMMTLYREQATSRSNLKIVYVVKSIITSCKNVVKNFILSLPIDFLFLSSYPYVLTQEKL